MVSIMTGLKVVSLLITSVSSFEITGVDQNVQNVEPGETARLVCRSSQDWEFCQWSLKYSHQIIKRCTLEWKLVKVNRAGHFKVASKIAFSCFPL